MSTIRLSRVMELTVRTNGANGGLARVMAAVATQDLKLLAYSAYHDFDGPFVALVTEEVMKARQALEFLGFQCTTAPAILVSAANHTETVTRIGSGLQQAGVDIFHSYASYAGDGRFYAVLKTADDSRAIEVLSQGLLRPRPAPEPTVP